MLPNSRPLPRALSRSNRLSVLLIIAVTLCLAAFTLSSPAGARPPEANGSAESRAAATRATGLFSDVAPRRASLDADRGSVELGVKFKSKVAGQVTGAQVYKLAKRPGRTPASASLWSSSGERLATTEIERRRGTGWVSVRFPQPVKITARETYTVSVFAPKGRYAVTQNAFDKRTVRGDLVIPGARNGVYAYGATSAFPSESDKSSNYWVDVKFRASGKKTNAQDPTPTPTPVPTPTPTPQPGGFPDASNTGVPAGVALTPYNGPMTITQPGTVIDAKQINGGLSIQATGVTITQSAITGNVSVSQSGSLTISDTDIDGGDRSGTGLEAYNFTALRVDIVGGNRSMYCASDCSIRDSYVHGQMTDETGVNHESGIRMEQNTTIVHNTIACDAPIVPPDAGCSAGLTGYGDFAPIQNNLIEGNLFKASTGSACAYGGSSKDKPYSDGARDIRFINNVFERGSNGKCGVYFPVTDFNSSAPGNVFTGNVWDKGGAVRP